MKKNEIIIQVGAEGGAITLYGVHTDKGWLYSRKVIDQSLDMLDELWIEHDSKIVNSWLDALELLDPYPWQCLYPLKVHPQFQEMVLQAVSDRD